ERPDTMKVCLYILLLFTWDCEVIPGTLKQIDAGSSLKHFTVGPAGELGANSSKNIFRFADGSFKLISSKKCCGILLSVQSVYCFTFRHLAGIMLSSWVSSCIVQSVTGASCGGSGVFEAVARALSMVEVDADGSVFGFKKTDYYEEKCFFSLAETIILWYFRVGVTISNPPGSSWTNIVICLNGHKHVTFDLGRLYVICSDGSIMRCI
uniref:Uncharacterized protein n=1 Tax=Cyprinus carpio TaxID=7962 RepID=A0A8C1MD22_CYPCA